MVVVSVRAVAKLWVKTSRKLFVVRLEG